MGDVIVYYFGTGVALQWEAETVADTEIDKRVITQIQKTFHRDTICREQESLELEAGRIWLTHR